MNQAVWVLRISDGIIFKMFNAILFLTQLVGNFYLDQEHPG